MKKIWIVGGSSGIGLELVKLWLYEGHSVVVSSRNAQKSEALEELKKVYNERLITLDLDASLQDEVLHVSQEAWQAFNGLDWWFYNAGAYEVMNVNSLEIDKFIHMNEVNYLGAVRILNAILPKFLEQKSGRIIWNASLSSYYGLPYGGGYSAPKAALVNLAQALQPELLNQGIKLQIINHGFVKTRLTQKNDFEMPGLMEPSEAAKEIFKGLNASYQFEIRFPFQLSFFLRIIRALPESWALAITRRMLR